MENFKPIKDIYAFEKLMPFKVKNILLIASLYDSFLLADDETLNESFFSNNPENEVKDRPKILRAKSQEEALAFSDKNKFDLIISMIQVGESNMDFLVSQLKEKSKNTPIVFLSFNIQDIMNISEHVKENASGIFLWQGDTRIFSAIINLIEDSKNFEHDSGFGVQSVLLVEDNIKFYSIYLPVIYSELMKQTQIVMSDELNPVKKNLRLKARPKIILKNDFESAMSLYSKYKENILGVITDVEYPKDNKSDSMAGIALAEYIKKDNPDMPVLIQSSNSAYQYHANRIGASFVNKNSSDLSKQIRHFIQRYFGFGDFIFSDEYGQEIAKATDLNSMIKILKNIPASSIIYHASRNHFSKWLFARTEFEIAYNLRPKKISEFKDAEEIRKYLLETLHQFIYKTQLGSVLKFDKRLYDSNIPFAKIGNGSIGGKARGLAFIDYLISKDIIPESIDGIKINTPNSIVVSTDVFDFFIDNNNLESFINENYSDEQIANIFSKVKLPDYAMRDIVSALEKLDFPIAVRSSSILEDSKTHPFAGIYRTYMLANNSSSFSNRLSNLELAIKYIYASVFSKEAQSFRKISTDVTDEEKMAVIIQKVVGQNYFNNYYYPLASGVIQSYNFYPIHPLKSTDPIVHLCMGLGETIVSGYNSLRYSPSYPQNIHQFATIDDMLANSQKKFIALNMAESNLNLKFEDEKKYEYIDIEDAQKVEGFEYAASYYIKDEDRVYDSFRENSIPIITFAPIIKNQLINLNKLFLELSRICCEAMGSNIEMEFALDYDLKEKDFTFNILQIRPMTAKSFFKKVNLQNTDNKEKIIFSSKALGNGYINEISDIVIVRDDSFSNLKTMEIAAEIDKINQKLKNEGKRYLLIGPGRWGSSDIHLGIPVKWNNISMAKVIVEAKYGDFVVDPSYGTHFFHNVTSLDIGYLSLISGEDYINWDWIKAQRKVYQGEYISHIKLEKNLDIRIDGNSSQSLITY